MPLYLSESRADIGARVASQWRVSGFRFLILHVGVGNIQADDESWLTRRAGENGCG
jgi:hypothetical protein